MINTIFKLYEKYILYYHQIIITTNNTKNYQKNAIQIITRIYKIKDDQKLRKKTCKWWYTTKREQNTTQHNRNKIIFIRQIKKIINKLKIIKMNFIHIIKPIIKN